MNRIRPGPAPKIQNPVPSLKERINMAPHLPALECACQDIRPLAVVPRSYVIEGCGRRNSVLRVKSFDLFHASTS